MPLDTNEWDVEAPKSETTDSEWTVSPPINPDWEIVTPQDRVRRVITLADTVGRMTSVGMRQWEPPAESLNLGMIGGRPGLPPEQGPSEWQLEQRPLPSDLANLPGPVNARPTFIESMQKPIGGEIPIPSGTGPFGIAASALAKVPAGIANYLRTPQGMAESAAALNPVLFPYVALKWSLDMVEGGVRSALDIKDAIAQRTQELIADKIVTANQLGLPEDKKKQDEFFQRIADDAVSGVAGFGFGAALGRGAIKGLRGGPRTTVPGEEPVRAEPLPTQMEYAGGEMPSYRTLGDEWEVQLPSSETAKPKEVPSGQEIATKEVPAKVEVAKAIPQTAAPLEPAKPRAEMSPKEVLDAATGEQDPMEVLRQHYRDMSEAFKQRKPINMEAVEKYSIGKGELTSSELGDFLYKRGYVANQQTGNWVFMGDAEKAKAAEEFPIGKEPSAVEGAKEATQAATLRQARPKLITEYTQRIADIQTELSDIAERTSALVKADKSKWEAAQESGVDFRPDPELKSLDATKARLASELSGLLDKDREARLTSKSAEDISKLRSAQPAQVTPPAEAKEAGKWIVYEKPDSTAAKGKRYIVAGPEEYGIKLVAKQNNWKKVGNNLTKEEALKQQESKNLKAGIPAPGELPSVGPGAASPGDVPSEPPVAKVAAAKAESAPEQNRPSGIVSPFSVALHNIWNETVVVAKGLMGQSMPRTTKANRIVGETGVEYASSRIAARPMADLFSASVLEGTNVDPFKFGAALVEDNLASVREGFRQKATELLADGKPEESARATANADAVKSIIGAKGSPFKTWEDYQEFLNTPEFKAAAAKHIQHWKETIEPQFKEAQRLDPDIELPSRGLQTGARVNLKAVMPDEAAVRPVSSVDFPRLTGTFRKKSPFGLKAMGTGDVYEIHYPELIANTFEKQLEIANKNRFDKSLVEAGLAEIHRPGWRGTIDGKNATSFPLKRGVRPIKTSDGEAVAANQSVNIYVRSDLASEYRTASNVDQKFRIPYVTRMMNVINRAALAGLTDFTVHTSNQMTALFNSPTIRPLFIDTLLSLTSRSDAVIALTKALIKATHKNKGQLAELVQIGAMRAGSDIKGVLGMSGRILKANDNIVRMTLDDAFKQLASDGIVEDTPTERREFANQVGQYNRRLQGPLTRFLRDTGFGPFVTAGKTFNALGARMVTLSPAAKATSAATAMALRINLLSKWIGTGVLAGMLNYLLTAKRGGGVMGRPGTPLGSVDTGKDDKNGKPLTFPLADVVGVGRGFRVSGLRGFIESKRLGLDTPTAMDAVARDIINAQIGPVAGPVIRFASVAATGKAPAINVGRVAPVVPPGENQTLVNVEQALIDANPVVASVNDVIQGKSASESLSRQLPRFTLRPGRRSEMVEKFPEIVEKARAREFEDWIVHQARQLPMAERADFINKQILRLPVSQQDHARQTMQWRGVYKYQ